MAPLLLAAALAALPADGAAAAPGGAPDALRVYDVSLAVDLPVTLGAAAAAALPYAFASRLITPRCPCDRREVPRFDRFAIGLHGDAADVASDVAVALAVAGPLAADALRLRAGAALWADAVVLSETLAVNSALVVLAKYAAQRPLPRTYAGDPSLVAAPGGYRSFYSGHTSTAVAALAAAAWTRRLRDGPSAWPWIVTAGAGVGIGALRVAAGRHFPSDVAMGALAGAGVGTLVPLLHARRLSLIPDGRGLAIAGRF